MNTDYEATIGVTIIAPAIGVFLANLMWLASLKVAYVARYKNKQLGSLNPLPFTMIVINCIGQLLYGILIKNYFIFFANFFGLLIGLFCCTTSITLLTQSNNLKPNENDITLANRIEAIMIGGIAAWFFILLLTEIVFPNSYPSDFVIGIICNVTTIGYYASPLSSLYNVIKTKDSSSLHLPSILANLLNATMWLIFGFYGLNNIIVWLPNVVGITLVACQLTIILIYNPKRLCCCCNSSRDNVSLESVSSKSNHTIGSTDNNIV